MATRKNLKPPRKCIFCPGTRMSKEHFWPTWASQMLPRWRENAYKEVKLTLTQKIKVSERHTRERQGSVTTKKIRVVCEDCNNGWMSELETIARPILEPLIAGNPTTLNQNQQRILAEWITMKTMVVEWNTPADVVIPKADREAFKARRSIPAYLTIWIAKHNVPGWYSGFYKHAATLSLTPTPPPSARGGRKNVQTVAFGIGALFVYVMISDPGGVNLNDFIRIQNLPRLWPATAGELTWGAITIGGNVPGDIATAFVRLAAHPLTLWNPVIP